MLIGTLYLPRLRCVELASACLLWQIFSPQSKLQILR